MTLINLVRVRIKNSAKRKYFGFHHFWCQQINVFAPNCVWILDANKKWCDKGLSTFSKSHQNSA